MEDKCLFKRMQDGNEEAFKKLFLKYYASLCEYASQYIRDTEAEELVEDLMLFLWENRGEIVITTAIKSYLFIATKNRCLNAIKKNIYHEQVHSLIYEKLKDQFEDPDYYIVNELSNKIEIAIAKLPEKYRETFELSRFGEQTNAEIAKQLDVSIKTVEYRITQSLKFLRVELKEYITCLLFLI